MNKLLKKPTAEDYKNYYDTLAPEQQKQFRKAGLLNMINLIYTDKADDVIEDETPSKGAFASGRFLDKRGSQNLYFEFRLVKSGGEFILDYKPTKVGANNVN